MKTYIKTTLTILISGMLFSSCEDQLNQANPNQATEDTFWKDETDFNLALTSCYTPLKNALNGGYYGTRGVMLRIARADEVDFRNDISDVYTVNRFTNSNTNSLPCTVPTPLCKNWKKRKNNFLPIFKIR